MDPYAIFRYMMECEVARRAPEPFLVTVSREIFKELWVRTETINHHFDTFGRPGGLSIMWAPQVMIIPDDLPDLKILPFEIRTWEAIGEIGAPKKESA